MIPIYQFLGFHYFKIFPNMTVCIWSFQFSCKFLLFTDNPLIQLEFIFFLVYGSGPRYFWHQGLVRDDSFSMVQGGAGWLYSLPPDTA